MTRLHDTRQIDTRHREAINNIVMGTEHVNRIAVDWTERTESGQMIMCSTQVCSMQLARRIIYELLLPDANAAQINVRTLN